MHVAVDVFTVGQFFSYIVPKRWVTAVVENETSEQWVGQALETIPPRADQQRSFQIPSVKDVR